MSYAVAELRNGMFHVKHEGLGPAQHDRLSVFESLLRERAVRLGMIAESDLPRLRERHIEDCLRAADLVEPGDSRACDLGSGAGLPGIVVGIAKPSLLVILAEGRRKRAAFLEFAIERLGLDNVRVHAGRVQELGDLVDLCFARAFGDARVAWRAAQPLLRPGGRLVYFGGRSFDAVRDAPENTRIEVRADLPIERFGPLVIMARK